MATWRIIEQHGRIGLVYRNNLTGGEFHCGFVGPEVGAEGVVDWIFEHGSPAYGDLIELPSGVVIHYSASRARVMN